VFRDKACIVGIGETAYCRKPGSGLSEEALQLHAAVTALRDAGLSGSQIDGVLAFPNVGKCEAFAASLGGEVLGLEDQGAGREGRLDGEGHGGLNGLGGAAMAYVFALGDLSPTMLVMTTFSGMTAYPLLAIPLFILGGNIMSAGGLTKDLVRFTRKLLGSVSGGLGLATVFASAIFAAISGAAVATVVAIGMIMLPAMKQAGYDDEVAAGVTAWVPESAWVPLHAPLAGSYSSTLLR